MCPRGGQARDLIATAAKRLYSEVVTLAMTQLGSRLARILWTSEETKARCKSRFWSDGAKVLKALETVGSVACSMFRNLSLSRDCIKEVLGRFKGGGKPQIVFSGIVCATRFETFASDGKLLEVKCSKCGGVDSFDHPPQCTGVGSLPTGGETEEVLAFSVRLTREAARHAPIWPLAVEAAESVEISMEHPSGGSGSVVGCADPAESLSFNGDDEEIFYN